MLLVLDLADRSLHDTIGHDHIAGNDLFLVRKNVRKYSRIMELLRMKETLDKAKDEYRDPVVDPRLDGDN